MHFIPFLNNQKTLPRFPPLVPNLKNKKTPNQKNSQTNKKRNNNPRVCCVGSSAKMMMPDYPGGVTHFLAKNPRPGPDPGGGRNGGASNSGPSVVLSGGGGGVGGGCNTSLGQVHLNDRSSSAACQQQQQHQTSYPRPPPLPPSATGRLVQPTH